MLSKNLIEAIAATAELCGKTYTPAAAKLLAQDLAGYSEQDILKALTKCRKELKPNQFCLEAIVSRIDDGRPGAEEAWAMMPHDEAKTVVWTDEMSEAWFVAYPLLNDGDTIGARMAFKESYNKLLTKARDERKPIKWTASLGHDKNGRESVLINAIEKGRLSAPQVKILLPYHETTQKTQALLEKLEVGMLK